MHAFIVKSLSLNPLCSNEIAIKWNLFLIFKAKKGGSILTPFHIKLRIQRKFLLNFKALLFSGGKKKDILFPSQQAKWEVIVGWMLLHIYCMVENDHPYLPTKLGTQNKV